MNSSGEGFANVLEAASTPHGPDKRHITLSTGTAKRLAEYISELSRFCLGGRTPGDEQRLSTDAHGLVSLEEELEIALAVEEEAVLRGRRGRTRGGVHDECGSVSRDTHGNSSNLAAASNNASQGGNSVPLPEDVSTFAMRQD